MARLWWNTDWIQVSVSGDVTVDTWIGAIRNGLETLGYEVLSSENHLIDAAKGDIEVTVLYLKTAGTGHFADGTEWVKVFKQVQSAAADDALAEAAVNEVWTMIGNIGFL